MKKLLAVLLFSFLFIGTCLAQSYDLGFEWRLFRDSVKLSYKPGEYALIGLVIHNNGPDDFPGKNNVTFNAKVTTDEMKAFPTGTPSFVIGPINIPSIPKFGFASFSNPIKITIDKNYKVDSQNIIIIWPTETIAFDPDTNNNWDKVNFMVAYPSGINGLEPVTGIFPNPASDHIIISTNNITSSASITIRDMTGKIVLEKIIGDLNLSPQVWLPLTNASGQSLENGVYVLTVSTEKYQSVRKIMIMR